MKWESKDLMPDRQVTYRLFKTREMMWFLGEMVPIYLADDRTEDAFQCVDSLLDYWQRLLEAKTNVVVIVLAEHCARLVHAAVWDGVRAEAWSDEQLERIANRLVVLDPQDAASRAYRGEVAFARWLTEIRPVRIANFRSASELQWKEGWEWDRERIIKRSRGLWRQVRPQGIDLMKAVKGDRILLQYWSQSGGIARRRFSFQDLKDFRHRFADSPESYFPHAGGMVLLSSVIDADAQSWQLLAETTERALSMEAAISLLQAGIAVERHRLMEGECPERLEGLVPHYLPKLPQDPFDGHPIRYRRQPDGSPHLWSIGVDLIDEGGLPHRDPEKGDLVWITQPIPGFGTSEFRR